MRGFESAFLAGLKDRPDPALFVSWCCAVFCGTCDEVSYAGCLSGEVFSSLVAWLDLLLKEWMDGMGEKG